MTDLHPITPPPGLRQLWAQQAQRMNPRDPIAWQEHIANQAARWGADQQLEQCETYWMTYGISPEGVVAMRYALRPLPSLKEQALLALAHLDKGAHPQMDTTEASDTIRRALKALPE